MRTATDKLRDYAFMLGKPFTYRQAMADLGLGRSIVVSAIARLKQEGTIQNIGKRSEGLYKIAKQPSSQELEGQQILREMDIKSVLEIAKERGVTKEAIYQKIRPFLPDKDHRVTPNQKAVLDMLREDDLPREAIGYWKTVESMIKRGWVEEIQLTKTTTCSLTEAGREVLDAQG